MINKNLSGRKRVIILVFSIVAIVFVVKLFFLQVVDQSYKLSSQNNVLRYITQYPARGKIYDRNGILMVYNEAAFDLLVVPQQVKKMDTSAFCRLLGIDQEIFSERLHKAKSYSRYRPSVFLEQITKEDYGYIAEKLYQFPGFYFQARTLRHYPQPIAAHVLGDVGEVNRANIDKDSYYKTGDYIGKSGIERFYEKDMRGHKGLKIVMVDVYNREKGSFQDGRYDTMPVSGSDLIMGLDAELQAYGEALMQGKTGSVVAIEPATGEILSLITSPSFDPNLLVGRIRGENYNKLQNDSLKPLINRAISGSYPPGSTFKMVNALVALQSGAITENTRFSCQGKLSRPIRCTHDHNSPLALLEAMENSCNPYFWNTFRSTLNNPKFPNHKDAYDFWFKLLGNMGLGHPFNTDIPFELSGNIPSRNYFDKLYRGSWNALTVRSLSIGQGEILLTPLQLANLAAIFSNQGFYYPPHLIRAIKNDTSYHSPFTEKIETGIDAKHFEIVKQSMLDVFEGDHGTARYYKIDSIRAAGKTGTVQNPHGEDHSMFIAFAPYDEPQIAIAVVVENAGYGSTWAAPIASLMMEKYLKGYSTRKALEKRMMEANFHLKTKKP
ncbi:MAG: penicillin-binding protein 2 [Bacteroidetes bacterium]|jgi:penicillin-binding protein 2|nr:penicillin-binding protein 2 [Bacteroidota bacterium]